MSGYSPINDVIYRGRSWSSTTNSSTVRGILKGASRVVLHFTRLLAMSHASFLFSLYLINRRRFNSTSLQRSRS